MDRSRVAGVRGILFTDMVGSADLRTRLGDDVADALRRDHDAILQAAVAAHEGTVLRSTGDGVKAAFASASAAIAAAVEMQRDVTRYGRSAKAVAPFQIRVGISVGEVVDDDGDLHGVAVIEGARLEALAEPGGILATDLVQRLGARRVDVAFEEVGPRRLKGLEDSVTIVRVIDVAPDTQTRPVPKALSPDRRFPLVGRAAAVATARRCWDNVLSGSATTLFVAGEPGMGKSRFLAETADYAHADGALVLAGTCDSQLAMPYEPFAEAFRYLGDLDHDVVRAIESGDGHLAALFPGQSPARFADGAPSARFELFEAVVALLNRLAQEQPLVLAIEDVQWAAAPTVQLLRHLVHHVAGTRVLFLASYRVDEVGPEHPLHHVLSEVRTAPSVSRLVLGPLAPEDIVDLVLPQLPTADEHRLGTFARRVCDESGGSPFFVCELLHHLVGTGALEDIAAGGSSTALPIPDSVRDVVIQRLGLLPADVGELLPAAAVIGPTFDLEVLAAVTGLAIEDVLDRLEVVERASLVREVGPGRFSFGHAIVRATLVERLSATRRALAHRRVAETIESLGRVDHDELAHHWQQAGDEDRAMVHLGLAARRDLEALAYESAAEKYQTILAHDRDGRGPSTHAGAAVAEAWLGLGRARRALGQDDYIVAIEQAGRLGRKLGDVDVVADAAIASLWPGGSFVTPGLSRTGLIELAEDALALIDSNDRRRPRILAVLAAHLTYTGARDRREALLQEALDLAHRLGEPELIGRVLVAEFLCLWDPTTADRRAAIADELARMARASGEVDLAFYAGFFLAITAAEGRDIARARLAMEGLTAPIAAAHNPYFAFLAERLAVSLDIFTGRPELQRLVDSLAERYADTYADTDGTWSLQTGALALQRGRFAEVAPVLRTMTEESEIAATWRPPLGLALLEAGEHDAAMTILDDLPEPPLDYFWLTTMQIVAELAVGLDRTDVAANLYRALLPFRQQLGITASGSLCLGLVATTLGSLALALGDHADATELLRDAVDCSDTLDAPFERVRARRLLATALMAGGATTTEVESLIRTAADLAAAHDFKGEQRLLAPLLAPDGEH